MTTETLKIPSPEHGPIKVMFCGTEYRFKQPSRLVADELKGYILRIVGKMSADIQQEVFKISEAVAASKDIETEAQKLAAEMTKDNMIFTMAGQYLATVDIFNFICHCLEIGPRTREYCEDHYDRKEMMQVYLALQGAILRPRSGIGRDMTPADTNPIQTDSTDTVNETCLCEPTESFTKNLKNE